MSNKVENNCHLFPKNKSTQNLYLPSQQQNKYSNNLTDSSSTFITAKLHSLNSNKNPKNKGKNNLENKNSNTCFTQRNIKEAEQREKEVELLSSNKTKQNTVVNHLKDSNEMKESNNCELNNNSFKDKNDFRKKRSKMHVQHSAKASKQIISIYNGIEQSQGTEEGNNIIVKKNLKLGKQKSKKSFRDKNNNNDSRIIKERENKNINEKNNKENGYVKYVNNDRYNVNENILNMTQIYSQSKYIFNHSESSSKIDRKKSMKDSYLNTSERNKNNHNFNYINYNNYKLNFIKSKELVLLSKDDNKRENNNNMNSFVSKNISTSPNSNNKAKNNFSIMQKNNVLGKSQSKTDNNSKGIQYKSNGSDKCNDSYNKKIYFIKPTQQRKISYNKSNNEKYQINKDNKTIPSSIGSTNAKDNNKNTLDSINDIFNKNIDNPEELHFLYIKILQNGKEISKKFEIESI